MGSCSCAEQASDALETGRKEDDQAHRQRNRPSETKPDGGRSRAPLASFIRALFGPPDQNEHNGHNSLNSHYGQIVFTSRVRQLINLLAAITGEHHVAGTLKRTLIGSLLALSVSAPRIQQKSLPDPGGAGGGKDTTARGTGESAGKSGLVKTVSYQNMSAGGTPGTIARISGPRPVRQDPDGQLHPHHRQNPSQELPQSPVT